MKVIVIYKPDGQIAVIHPAYNKKRADESEVKFLERVRVKVIKDTDLEALPFDVIDKASLPADRLNRDKWRGEKDKGIRIDNSVVTLAERRKAVEDALDVELGKTNADPMKAIRLQRQLEKRDY